MQRSWYICILIISIAELIDRVNAANPHDSSFPIRDGQAAWFVDAKSFMASAADALLAAKQQIMITGWWLTPELYLKRESTKNGGLNDQWRLDKILQKKATEGVIIHVQVFWEFTPAMAAHNSNYTVYRLASLHKNIKAMRHGDDKYLPIWSHHEKLIIIDKQLAFVGGIDLGYGRWDDEFHKLFDSDTASVWPGKDYVNFFVNESVNPEMPEKDYINRTRVPRVPWHDTHAVVKGPSAKDVVTHFVQRWQKAFTECCNPSYLSKAKDALHGAASKVGAIADHGKCADWDMLCRDWYDSSCGFGGFFCKDYNGFGPDDLPANQELDKVFNNALIPAKVQVLRSVGEWSTHLNLEKSIQNTYLDLIKNAQHFIYIENQFFISLICPSGQTTTGDAAHKCKTVENGIAEALLNRIVAAHKNNTNFRVYITIPLLPGFEKDSESIYIMLNWTYSSISRGPKSLLKNLEQQIGAENVAKYIKFTSLRQWARKKLQTYDQLVTQPIYVHSKVMIIDDRYVIIGSANINDRSQNGDRDSEVALYIEDTTFVNSKMDGKDYQAGKFANSLRLRYFNEFLGQLPQLKNVSKADYIDPQDPVSNAFYQQWNDLAKKNADIYQMVFKNLGPSDSIKRMSDWKKSYQGRRKRDAVFLNALDEVQTFWDMITRRMFESVGGSADVTPENLQKLMKVRGYLVELPYMFLADDVLPETAYKSGVPVPHSIYVK